MGLLKFIFAGLFALFAVLAGLVAAAVVAAAGLLIFFGRRMLRRRRELAAPRRESVERSSQEPAPSSEVIDVTATEVRAEPRHQ